MGEATGDGLQPPLDLARRSFLKGLGLGAGALLANGLALGFPREAGAEGYRECLTALGQSLRPAQRRLLVWPADHPSRQVTWTGRFLDRPPAGALLTGDQLALLRRLFRSLGSESGLPLLAQPVGYEGGGIDGYVLAFYGDPASGQAQTLLCGAHLALRGGGMSREGAAFGGPMAYGHQVGNGEFRVPGNAFAHHSDAMNRLYALMNPAQRRAARKPAPPHELLVQAQPHGAAFPGVRIGSLGDEARDQAQRLLETVLAAYPTRDAAEALDCIDHNGGADALHVACYENAGFYRDGAVVSELSPAEQADRPDPYWQVWRLEGPGSVIHFKGAPHVHAYLNVVRDPASHAVGETLAQSDGLLEGDALRALLEAALRRGTGAPFAFYPDEPPARIGPGPVTTGLAWALDPWGNHPAVATLRGEAMAPALRNHLTRRGNAVEPGVLYRVATVDYFASSRDRLGLPDSVEVDRREIRELLVDYIRERGLEAELPRQRTVRA